MVIYGLPGNARQGARLTPLPKSPAYFAALTPTEGLQLQARLSEGAGQKVNMSVNGQSRTLEVHSGVTWDDGYVADHSFKSQPGEALEIAEAGDFDKNQPYTAAAWVKLTSGGSGSVIARMDDKSDHPLSSRRADGFRFAGSWSSRLRDQGFHTNHIHPMGWISSCYYVAVPDTVEDEAARQGWIKFGEPSFAARLAEPVRRAVKPVAGRLVLFPSYMWHGTVPFHGDSARTTIAFDAIPV